jgi:hypothetical protein
MKTHSIMIMSDGKAIDACPLDPVQTLRLMAFAKTNKLGFAEMVDLAIRFAVCPDGNSPDLRAPDEEDIVAFAANLLMRLTAGKGKRQ